PVIVANGDKLILLKNGKREEKEIIPDLYTTEKTVDHMPLALFVLLERHTDTQLTNQILDQLRDLKTFIASAKDQLTSKSLSPESLQRQHIILDTSSKFIDDAVTRQTVSAAQLKSFVVDLRKPLESNIYDAISAELTDLNKVIMVWKNDMSSD